MALDINFNEVEELEEWKNPEAGVYVCKVEHAINVPEKRYVMLQLDIADGQFKGFAKEAEERTHQDWSYIKCYLSYKPTALGFTKHNIRIIAESSKVDTNQLENDFGKTDGKCLEGCYVGIVVGMTEYQKNDGTIGQKLDLPKLVSAQEAKNNQDKFIVPALKKMKASTEDAPAAGTTEKTPFGEAVTDKAEKAKCPF